MRFARRASLAAGVLWPLAFAPFGVWPLALVSLTALFFLLDDASPRDAFVRAYLWGVGAFGAGVWWVFVSMHDFGGLHWSLAGAITVVLIAVLALFTARCDVHHGGDGRHFSDRILAAPHPRGAECHRATTVLRRAFSAGWTPRWWTPSNGRPSFITSEAATSWYPNRIGVGPR
jgi:hypothetical protein